MFVWAEMYQIGPYIIPGPLSFKPLFTIVEELMALLVPSKYAPLHGIHFVISFAYGALIANMVLLLFYVKYNEYTQDDIGLHGPTVQYEPIQGCVEKTQNETRLQT